MAFLAVLGRDPGPAEIVALRARLESGAAPSDLLDELRASPEARDVLARSARAAVRRELDQGAAGPVGGGGGERLVFVHIMKVGGLSLSDLLGRWAAGSRVVLNAFLDELALTPRPRLRQTRVISGHIPAEALGLIPGPFRTTCVLRDPLRRTLSHWAELRTSEPRFSDLTLDRFVHDEYFDVPSGNYQARQLGHRIGIEDAWSAFSPASIYSARGGDPGDPYLLQSLFDSTPISGDDDQLHRLAADTLRRVDHVGVTDRLDALAARLAPIFDARPEPVPRLHPSSAPPTEEIPAAVRRHIDERTRVDRALYELAGALAATAEHPASTS
jgi:hypothetical protein